MSVTLQTHKQRGFTIVELLIVIVVIAILAAISIVAYNGIQNRANDTAVQTDLSNFGKKMEIYQVDNSRYPQSGSDFTSSMGISFSRAAYGLDFQNTNLRYCINASTNKYVILANSKSGNYFKYISGSGLSTNSAAYGWDVCAFVGVSSTNPQVNALSGVTWASWVN